MSELDVTKKAAFAAALLQEPVPMRAASLVEPNNTALALRMAVEWEFDGEVRAEMKRLTTGDASDVMPGKNQAALLAWQMAQALPEGKDRVAALKLFAQMTGLIEKGDTNVNVAVVNKVMEVQRFASDEDWEIRAAAQQARLLNVSDSRH